MYVSLQNILPVSPASHSATQHDKTVAIAILTTYALTERLNKDLYASLISGGCRVGSNTVGRRTLTRAVSTQGGQDRCRRWAAGTREACLVDRLGLGSKGYPTLVPYALYVAVPPTTNAQRLRPFRLGWGLGLVQSVGHGML